MRLTELKIIFTQLHVKLKIYYRLEPMGLVIDVWFSQSSLWMF